MHMRSGEIASAYMAQASQPLSCSRSEVQASLDVLTILLMQLRCVQSSIRNLVLPAYNLCTLPSANPISRNDKDS